MHIPKQIIVSTSIPLFAVLLGVYFFSRHTSVSLPKKALPATLSQVAHSTLFASNQWYSSLFNTNPSQPLFALPLVYKVTSDGLGFSYPTVVKTKDSIFASYDEDFHIGYGTSLEKPEVTTISDWSVNVKSTDALHENLSFTLAHGAPFTTITATGDTVVMTFSHPFTVATSGIRTISSGTTTASNFLVSTQNHNYIIALPQNIAITVSDHTLLLQRPKNIFVGLLDTKDHYTTFLKTASVKLLGTYASSTNDNGSLITKYSFITTSTVKPLIALYPHQKDTLVTPMPILGSYQSIRGTLSLVQTDSFSTTVPIQLPQSTFPTLENTPRDLQQAVKDDSIAAIKAPYTTSRDYFLGVWLGKISNLLLLSSSLHLDTEKKALLAYVEPKFIDGMKDFTYDTTTTSLIATKPEFGNEKLNDHHFHYGYFIRTAAVLATLDPTIIPKIKDRVNAMVGDIATQNRQSQLYPYLRNFDTYEGHSWADGNANFNDGNDQESSAEAINAWYGIYLWSNVTHDTSLTNLALRLYTTEIQSAKYYWFGGNGLYTQPYEHTIASIVWGGKVDFATWFSPKTNDIYGIQLLPFTPGSFYLGSLGDFTSFDKDIISHGGGLQQPEWNDIYLMWKSFYNPKEAYNQRNSITTFEDGNSKSTYLYFIYYNYLKNTK